MNNSRIQSTQPAVANSYREEVLRCSGLQGKTVLVVGMGVTGLSFIRFLNWLEIEFEIADDYIDDERLQQTLAANPEVAAYVASDFASKNQRIHRSFSEELFKRFDLLLVSPGVPLANPVFAAAAQHGAEILGDIALFARINRAKLIAVTGSNGKSTVVAWLNHILAASDLDAAMGGNIGKPVLDLLINGSNKHDVVVLELSSFQLELVDKLPCCSATVLNISEDHLDRYADIEEYAAVKAGIYEASRHYVLNAVDAASWPAQIGQSQRGQSLTEQQTTVAVYSSSKTAVNQELQDKLQAYPRSVVCVSAIDGEDWLMINAEALLPVTAIGLVGRHNLDNALAVIALLLPLDLPATLLKERLGNFEGLPHRMQLVAQIDGVRWFNDSKGTNVDACVKAISGIDAPVVLIAGGLGKGADFSPLRTPVSAGVKAVVLFGEDADQLREVLADLVPCHAASDMRDAVQQAQQLATSGDVVLLSPACASFDMFRSFEHRGEMFMEEVRRVAA